MRIPSGHNLGSIALSNDQVDDEANKFLIQRVYLAPQYTSSIAQQSRRHKKQ